jgi:hypothetical protein
MRNQHSYVLDAFRFCVTKWLAVIPPTICGPSLFNSTIPDSSVLYSQLELIRSSNIQKEYQERLRQRLNAMLSTHDEEGLDPLSVFPMFFIVLYCYDTVGLQVLTDALKTHGIRTIADRVFEACVMRYFGHHLISQDFSSSSVGKTNN